MIVLYFLINQSKHKKGKHVNISLSQTNKDSLKATPHPDEQTNIIPNDTMKTTTTATDTTVTTSNTNGNTSQSPNDTRYQSFSNIRAKRTSNTLRCGSSSRYSA